MKKGLTNYSNRDIVRFAITKISYSKSRINYFVEMDWKYPGFNKTLVKCGYYALMLFLIEFFKYQQRTHGMKDAVIRSVINFTVHPLFPFFLGNEQPIPDHSLQ